MPKKCESWASEKRSLRRCKRRRASQTVSTTAAATRRPVSRWTAVSRNPMSKRALCAASGASPANARKRRTASCCLGARRRSTSRSPVSRAIVGGSATRGSTRVSNVSAISSARTRTAPISHIRSRVADKPVVSRSKTTSSASSISVSGVCPSASPTRAAQPGEPRVTVDDVGEQGVRQRRGCTFEREENPGGLLRPDRALPRLDELDEPVGGIERQLHALYGNRTYVRVQGQTKGRP